MLTGLLLGAALTPSNVYSGLKIGWSFNMSIAAGLLAFGFWRLAERGGGARPWGVLENNINQTSASSAASIVSGGLVAPIPALTLLTGQALPWPLLAFWVFAVSALGVVVASGLRNQMLLRERLPFPAGLAAAETLRRIHGHGAEAAARLKVLLGGAGVSGVLKLAGDLAGTVERVPLPVALPGWGAARGANGVTAGNLGFSLDPSLLLFGFGAIIGLRAGISLLIGAIVGWGVLAPLALARGWASPGPAAPDAPWFGPLVEWLLWPGVTLMVVGALTAFAISFARLVARRRAAAVAEERAPPTIPPRAFAAGLAAALVLAVAAQIGLFGIAPWAAVLAVALSFVLAVVAGRVAGETGIAPIGAMGKITQLAFGGAVPGDVTANLMSANVTGGAAGQCADLLHDLRAGQILGATPAFQIAAQMFGVLIGGLVGSLVYLLMIPDPAAMLLTAEWPAPAVATWKAVAEVLAVGLGAIPPGAVPAMAIAGGLGLALALAEKMLPERAARLVPSAPALGLACVVPAWNALSLFAGALFAALVHRVAPHWAKRMLIALAAGLVVGESLAGVAVITADLVG